MLIARLADGARDLCDLPQQAPMRNARTDAPKRGFLCGGGDRDGRRRAPVGVGVEGARGRTSKGAHLPGCSQLGTIVRALRIASAY